MLATQNVISVISQFGEPQAATESTKPVCPFFVLIFNQYAPIKFFY